MVRSSLVLEDGTILKGVAFGEDKDVFGEVVFYTGMTGYQELLSDPASAGQIVVAAHPLVGNSGAGPAFMQSDAIHAAGLIVREWSRHPSLMYGGGTIDALLRDEGVPGIEEIDTRDLVIQIREGGSMRGAITGRDDLDAVLEELRRSPYPHEGDLVSSRSPRGIRELGGKGPRVGLLDYGCRRELVRQLSSRFELMGLPHDIKAREAMDLGLDGIVASSGPGDPAHSSLKGAVKTLGELAHELPTMAIGLGSQMLALAFGGETRSMHFGHRGANQPVRHEGRIVMTSQHHGFEVVEESLQDSKLIPDQFNIHDGSVEGASHAKLPIISVQYHPEASPGPRDSSYLFDRFLALLEGRA